MYSSQVMSDAADAAMHTLLYFCHASRVVTKMCEALCSDKNPKLRYCCAKYLLQVCVTAAWPPQGPWTSMHNPSA